MDILVEIPFFFFSFFFPKAFPIVSSGTISFLIVVCSRNRNRDRNRTETVGEKKEGKKGRACYFYETRE